MTQKKFNGMTEYEATAYGDAHELPPGARISPRRCECESATGACDAGGRHRNDEPCPRPAGKAVTIYGTSLCNGCASAHPPEYLKVKP